MAPQVLSMCARAEMAAIEDKAAEASLSKSVRIPHAATRLLLESIDMDEEKHDRLIQKMLQITNPNKHYVN